MARSNSGVLSKNAVLVPDGPHMVKRVDCDNTGAAVGYLMVFNQSTVPVDGQVPELERLIPIGGTGSFDFFLQGERFNLGLAVALSSTPAVLTTVATAVAWFQCEYA